MKSPLKSALVVLIALLVACGGEDRPLNVLIIAIDTLRADHLGCYGYERKVSPCIDSLASRGVLLERAISQAPWTLPSFASVFTSLYPTQHGATAVDSRLRPSVPTLASILRDRGYTTAALVNAPLLRPEYGLDSGFDFYDTLPADESRIAGQITEDALSWLSANKDRSFFLFVHYFDPHLPYSPPAPFDRRFNPDYAGPIEGSFDLSYFSSKNPPDVREEIASISPADRSQIVSLYDGEIAFTDSAVGVLLDGLRKHKLEQSTLVVLLSDHGEEFFDHGGLDHGHTFFDELLSVPLIFSLPGTLPERSRIRKQVRLIDVAPTILDILGLAPPRHFEGVSLQSPMVHAPEDRPDENDLLPPGEAYAEALRRNESVKCVSSYPWKLILDTRTFGGSLFNLEHDPGEQQDVSKGEPAAYRRLERALYRSIFGLSDSWYVEMAGGGEPHIFDVAIRVVAEPVPGTIGLHGLWESEGDHYLQGLGSEVDAAGSMLEIAALTVEDRITLAFKADPGKMPVEFDLRIDGEPAASRTFLGKSTVKPDTMPFSRVAGRKSVRSRGVPSGEIDPPYFLIWHSRPDYGGRTTARLEESTRRELKALGYIQ